MIWLASDFFSCCFLCIFHLNWNGYCFFCKAHVYHTVEVCKLDRDFSRVNAVWGGISLTQIAHFIYWTLTPFSPIEPHIVVDNNRKFYGIVLIRNAHFSFVTVCHSFSFISVGGLCFFFFFSPSNSFLTRIEHSSVRIPI